MQQNININGRKIGNTEKPFIIAEMSANHNGSIEIAKQIINHAYQAGADAVKLQTYRPDTITLNSRQSQFLITDGPWEGMSLFELFEKAYMPWEWHKPLFDHARKLGIEIFSSPFDRSAVDLLENLNTPAYKIASFEAIDIPLIEYAASTGKPMIISTGMANLTEINEAIDAAYGAGCKQVALLHCVSGYPAPSDDYNLKTIPDMIERFGLVTGLSDHTITNTSALASVALGASIIEKHFTLDRQGGGPDDSFSLEPDDLRSLCTEVRQVWNALGKPDYSLKESEKENVSKRKSIYVIRDIKAGEEITPSVIKTVRPGYGLAPKFYKDVIGMRATKVIKANSALTWDMLEH